MFCGNIFTSTDLQNHKKNHMKKLQKRFHRVNRALFLSLINAFELQKFIPKISQKNFWSAPCFPKIVCGGQCERNTIAVSHRISKQAQKLVRPTANGLVRTICSSNLKFGLVWGKLR